MKIWFTHFENEKWTANVLRPRVKSEIKRPQDWDREWKVKFLEKFLRIKKILRFRSKCLHLFNCFTLCFFKRVAIVWVSSVHSQTAGLIGWTGKKFMTNFRVTCIISLFSQEKEWNLTWFQFFWESERIFVSLFSRNEKWNVFLFYSFRKVIVKYLETEIERWFFQKNLENFRETRLLLVSGIFLQICLEYFSGFFKQNEVRIFFL